jgi:hypothetical protein
MRDLPVVLRGYRCTVVDPPCPKTKDDGKGGQVVVVNRDGVTQFVVALFIKQVVGPGERAPKGEETKVTLESDPGEGFAEGARVELVNPRINAYQIATEDGRSISGIAFKALGLKPATPTNGPPSPSPAGSASFSSAAKGGEDK